MMFVFLHPGGHATTTIWFGTNIKGTHQPHPHSSKEGRKEGRNGNLVFCRSPQKCRWTVFFFFSQEQNDEFRGEGTRPFRNVYRITEWIIIYISVLSWIQSYPNLLHSARLKTKLGSAPWIGLIRLMIKMSGGTQFRLTLGPPPPSRPPPKN